MVVAGGSRRLWALALVIAALTVALFWTLESATDQRGVLAIGLVLALVELIFVGAMSYVLGQNYCEHCGIGNLRDARQCWKCGRPLSPRGVEASVDEGRTDAP